MYYHPLDKSFTEQTTTELHKWVDFESQIRKIAMMTFHSPLKKQIKINDQRESLQLQFRSILKEVAQMDLRPELYNKLAKYL